MADTFIDIASYQSVTDAPAVARTGTAGAWVKLTGELGYENPKRDQQVNSLRNAGLAVGGYHFGDPRVDPVVQARHFGRDATRLGLFKPGSLFPMFDAENSESVGLKWSSPAQLNNHIAVWESVLRSEFGMRDYLVYGSESWFTSRWIDPRVWGDDHAWNWVANYNGRPGVLTLGWSHPQDALHQWRSDGVPFPGISASGLDVNVALRGHTRASLTIGNEGDWLMSLTNEEQRELLDAARKLTTLFSPTDDDRPLPIGTRDDIPGHILSVRGLQEKMRNAQAGDRKSIAAIEGIVNQLLARDGGAQVTLTDAQAQAGFESLGAQLAAQSGEALEDLYQRLVDTNSVDAVREVFAQYVGRATVELGFQRDRTGETPGQ